MSFVIDFFSNDQRLGGTEMEAEEKSALAFAREGLERHDAGWVRIADLGSGYERRLCARALAEGQSLDDVSACRFRRLCSSCYVDSRLPVDEGDASA